MRKRRFTENALGIAVAVAAFRFEPVQAAGPKLDQALGFG
jgi:hypothetical protein